MPAVVTFTVLGPVGASVDGNVVRIPGRRERAVLSVLLAAQGAAVSADRLVDDVWGSAAGDSAPASLQVAVSRLRALLEPGRARGVTPTLLVSGSAGYALRRSPGTVDADRLVSLVTSAHEIVGRDPQHAAALCDAAEELWHGPPYADGADSDLVRAERLRLSDLRLHAQEVRAEALLASGRHALVIGELEALVEANPFRERLWEFYVLALYRSGRQADALGALRAARMRLGDDLGIDPSPALQQLERAILNHDEALAAPLPIDTDAPAADAAAPAPTPPSARGPLVGRDVEFAQLRGHLARAAGGETSFVLVEGEPGIGKTRLLEELTAAARSSGFHVVWGRCSQAGVAPAFWPWLEVLRGLPTEVPSAALPTDVAALLDPGRSDAGDLTQERRFRLFDAVARTLAAAAASTPLLVVIEDLHWADPASAELLNHLVDTVYDAALGVAVSLRDLELGRSDAVADVVGTMTRRPGTRRMHLAGVAPAASNALVAGVVDRPVTAEVAAAIHRRGEGNPFCMGELTRLLASADALDDPGAVDRVDVPAGVRDVVRRRLAALPEPTRRLLEAAAVIGREFDLAVLVAASGRDIDETLDHLEPALVSRVVAPVAEIPGRHRFAHALVTEAALAELTSLRAARLHARVAEALTDIGGDAEIEVVAWHLWAGAAVVGATRAAEALERAAEISMRRTAYEAAQDLLERALSLRRTTGSGAGPAADEAELVTTLQLGGLRRARFGYSRAFEAIPLDRPKELALRTGRTDLYIALLHLHWGALATSGQVGPATDLARQMRELGEGSEDEVVRLLAHHSWGVQCWHLGRLQEGARHMARVDKAVQQMGPADRDRLAMFDSPPLFAAFALHVLELAGEAPDAEEHFEALVARHGAPYEVAVIANFAAFSAVCAGDAPRALRWGRRGMRSDSEWGFGMFGATAQMYAGWAHAMLEDPEEGLALYTRGFSRFRAADARTALGAVVGLQVEAMLAAGRPVDQVAAALDAGTAEAEAMEEPLTVPYLAVARAIVRAEQGAQADEINSLLDRAAAGADTTGNVLLRERIARTAQRLDVPRRREG